MNTTQSKFFETASAYTAAWSSGNPDAVASFYTSDGQISINRGDALKGRAAIAEMAAGYCAEFPDLALRCDTARHNGDGHALFGWTLEGTHSETGNRVKVQGWEEWELDGELKVKSSLGWFDAAEYERQIAEGI
jgi:uncharacterized protein (TIGR02246 family)